MQRLTITGGTYTFVGEWIGHVLYAVPVYQGISICRRLIGYDVYFPHPVGGGSPNSSGNKTKWYFREIHCHLLDPLPYKDKPRFTLITSFLNPGTKVWAKVVTSEPSCHGCAYASSPCMGKTPPCSPTYRHRGDSVIFITSVTKW